MVADIRITEIGGSVIDVKGCENVLAVFTHPDDGALASGGTIAKLYALGVNMHIAIPATGIHNRRNMESEDLRDANLQKIAIELH
jgi:LmbE family N-acetylglucosaminyl deacetylase